VVEPSGERTFFQTLVFSILLIVVSLMPSVIGMTGWFYDCGALLIGLCMLEAPGTSFASKAWPTPGDC
jgi:heme O synthase-like polyprenyltransferase